MKAKVPLVRRRKSAKIVGAEECLNTQTAPDRNGQTLKEGAHRVTAIPHSTASRPVRIRKPKPATFASYIREEMKARGWSRSRLAYEMTSKEYGINRLTVDFILWSGGPKQGMVLGEETARSLSVAFGVSTEFFLNLWESCHGHERPSLNPPVNTEAVRP